MNAGNEEKAPLGPMRPRRPLPVPTPLIPSSERNETERMLRQILERLNEIEKRLDRIEKLLT